MKQQFNAEHFQYMTGQLPSQDDLDRCNCIEAGNKTLGHFSCGVCEHKKPVWQCMDCFSKVAQGYKVAYITAEELFL